jgi:hypothetical protein
VLKPEIVQTDPIYPSDKSEISNETGIDSDNLEAKDNKVYLKKELAENIAKQILKTDAVDTHILPIFSGAVKPNEQVAAISINVKGSDLLAQFPDEVNLLGMTSGNKGKLLGYVKSESEYDNGKFTILSLGTIFDGEINPAEVYELKVFIKDGGIFDLDGHANGKVTASIFLASEKAEKCKGGGGCNADYGYLAFALVFVTIALIILRKKQ